MSDSELEMLAAEQENDLKGNNEPDLGVPDFSAIMEDDAEITSADIDDKQAKAQKGLKPSFMIAKILPITFGVIARRKGEHWLLDDEEVEALCESVNECLDYYYPDLSDLPPWVGLGFTVGMIIMPRIMLNDVDDDTKKELESALSDEQPEQKPVGYNTVLKPKEVKK